MQNFIVNKTKNYNKKNDLKLVHIDQTQYANSSETIQLNNSGNILKNHHFREIYSENVISLL